MGEGLDLKKHNTEKTKGEKKPAFVKSEHVNSVPSILSHLLGSPSLQNISHTEMYFWQQWKEPARKGSSSYFYPG